MRQNKKEKPYIMNIGQNKSDENRILYMDDHLAVFNKAAGDICAEGRVERGEKCGEVYGMEDGAEHFAPCTEACGTNGQSGENERDIPYLPEVFCESLKKNQHLKDGFLLLSTALTASTVPFPAVFYLFLTALLYLCFKISSRSGIQKIVV